MASLLAGFIFDVVYGSRTLSLLLCTLGVMYNCFFFLVVLEIKFYVMYKV